ncbi:MAG: galactose oxidase-like domain-containing protein [Pseudomonadota bacterium]
MEATKGDWGAVIDTTIIGIHQVVMEDGRVLYWGGDGNGNAFSNTQKYGIFDPATQTHEILEADHIVRMFCGAGVIIPGTDKVLIAGGNGSGAPGGQIFDLSDMELVKDEANELAVGRFYPTTVSLSTGQVVILGGNGNKALNGIPEIFTLGEGWRQLEGATDPDVSTNWWYPKAWVNSEGEVLYFAINSGNQSGNVTGGTLEVMALDPSGNGSIEQVGVVPFSMDATSPAVMYDVGKIVIMDATGNLWYMDINGPEPVFTFAADLPTDRNNSDMTVLADGRILINGGTTTGNSQDINNAILESTIFDPYSGTVTVVDAEDVMRLYHSSSTLLADGTVLSMGGGGLNGTLDFMDAQIYTPDYLFNEDGTLADRPEILSAPETAEPGDTLTITVDDASTIARMSFVKTGAVTHSINMESGRMDLDFTVIDNQTIEVTLPENANVVGAGNWMLFAIDDEGVPSVAPIIKVQPTQAPYEAPLPLGAVEGTLSVDYFNADADVLADVDFDGPVIFEEDLTEIQENAGNGTFYAGGPDNQFAARYTGEFLIETAGEYTFFLNSDDGSRLLIDGQEIILNDGLHAEKEISGTITLDAGIHTLSADYFEQGGQAVIELDWSGPDFARSSFAVTGDAPVLGDVVNDIQNEVQFLDGIGENDIFAIDGVSSDYGWGPTEDGEGIVVWGPTGHDLLYGFEAIKFNETTISLVPDEPGIFNDIEGVTQFLSGTTDGEETFVIDGNSTDYGWGPTEDGQGIVVWGPTGTDLLYDFDKIAFNDQTVTLTDPTAGLVVDDDPLTTQYEFGTDNVDRFVINDVASNYGVGPTGDGGIVVWNTENSSHDILYDFEEIEFNDSVVQLEQFFA